MNVVDVRVRPSHPTGTYRRAGLTFHTNEATVLDLDTLAPDVRERIEADGWLDLRPVKDAAPVEPPPMIVTVPAWLVEAYAGDREAIQYALDFRLGHLAPPPVEAEDVPDIDRIMIPVPAWLLAQFDDDAEAAADALEHCTGPFEALVQSREIVPAAEPEPEPEEPKRTRRKANHEADPEPEFGPPAEG